MVLEPAPITPTIADAKLRRSVLVLRWTLLALYVGLVGFGVLDVSPVALAWSASLIFAYDVFHTLLEFRLGNSQASYVWLFDITRHLDVLTVTIALIAIHDVRNPVWAVYFVNLVSVAHLVTRRQMAAYTLWTVLNYVLFAAVTRALGHDVSWEYGVVVALLLAVMGSNASMLAGGEERLRDLISAMATTDQLTGLPNRRQFHQSYPASVEEAVGSGVPLALMLIDVDHFKEINDRDGHPAGDDKLREVAHALQGAMRAGDLVARYGGDEFIVVAPATGREAAAALAERLRTAAAACDASVSIGVALFPEDADDRDRLVEVADTALYQAKQAGRNQVRSAA